MFEFNVSDCFNCTLFKEMIIKLNELENAVQNQHQNSIASKARQNLVDSAMYQLDSKLKLAKNSENKEAYVATLLSNYK